MPDSTHRARRERPESGAVSVGDDYEVPGRRSLLVLITGAGPGLGKSLLANRLHADLAESHVDAVLFEEHDIVDRLEFAPVMEEFRSRGRVEPETLLDCAAAYGRWCVARAADVYVLDALFPYLPSLLAWGYSDRSIERFLDRLRTRLDEVDMIELHLDGDATAALRRASAREGGDWIDRHVAKVSTFDDASALVETRGDVAAYTRVAATRSRQLLRRAPWPVHFLHADDGPDSLFHEARRIIASRSA